MSKWQKLVVFINGVLAAGNLFAAGACFERGAYDVMAFNLMASSLSFLVVAVMLWANAYLRREEAR